MRSTGLGILAGQFAYRLSGKYLRKQIDWETKQLWERKNFAGQPVSLSGGVKLASASISSALMLTSRPAVATAHFLATGTGAILGYIDDLQLWDKNLNDHNAEPVSETDRVVLASSAAKGFHGHLNALKNGHVTTGLLKIVGIGSGAALAAGILTLERKPKNRHHVLLGLSDWITDTVLIAGSANLANLFDLRPGRALKIAGLAALPLSSGRAVGSLSAGTALGLISAALPADLAAREMLGDTGANTLGAHLGVAAANRLSRWQKICALIGIGALTVASEKVSFSKVIEASPVLKYLDDLGRTTTKS